MFAELIEAFVKFCEEQEAQDLLEHKLLDPLTKRYRWLVSTVQSILVLALLQTLLLVALLCVVMRHHVG